MNTFLPKRHHRRRRRRRSSLEGGGGTRLFRYLVVFVFAFARTTISIRADDATILGGGNFWEVPVLPRTEQTRTRLRTTRYLHRLRRRRLTRSSSTWRGGMSSIYSLRAAPKIERLSEWKLKRNINRCQKPIRRATSPIPSRDSQTCYPRRKVLRGLNTAWMIFRISI